MGLNWLHRQLAVTIKVLANGTLATRQLFPLFLNSHVILPPAATAHIKHQEQTERETCSNRNA